MKLRAHQESKVRLRRSNMPMACFCMVTILAASAVLQVYAAHVAFDGSSPFSGVAPSTPEELAFWEEQERILQAGRYHKELLLLVDVPGNEDPEFRTSDDVTLADSTSIIGIEVAGEACAFPIDSLRGPERHIVNMVFDQTAVSVTYCDLVDCARVLKDDRDHPIPLRVGGLDKDLQMVFLLHGERYGQESTALPFEDHPFTRTSLGEWKQTHPDTSVYIGS